MSKSQLKTYIIWHKDCYNAVIITSNSPIKAFNQAVKFMQQENKFFSDVDINKMIEIPLIDGKTNLYNLSKKTKIINSEIK